MTALRLVKPRAKDQPTENDLRGLGSADILQNSFPYAALTVQKTDDQKIESFLQAYDLVTHPSHHPDTAHLRTRERQSGGHKKQAILLFAAAIELSRSHLAARCYLIQLSGLHQALDQAIREPALPAYDEDALTLDWSHETQSFSIDSAVTLALSQAGFPIHFSETTLHLSRAEIEKIHKDLMGVGQSQSHPKRKTG